MSILAQLWPPIPTSNSGEVTWQPFRAWESGVSGYAEEGWGEEATTWALVQRWEDTGQLGAPIPAQTLDEVGKWPHRVGVRTVPSSHHLFPGLGPSGKNLPCTQHSVQLVHSET